MNKHHLVTASLCLLSAAVGSTATYFVVQKYLGEQFDEQLRQEIETTKNFYQILHKKGEFETPEAAADKLIPPRKVEELLTNGGEFAENPHAKAAAQVLKEYGGHKLSERSIVTETVDNVFVKAELDARNETDAEWTKEEMGRTEEAPYVLKQEEFMENESEYVQASLTYYSGDGVLTDEADNKIDEVDEMVGDYNLIRFGHWSNDPHVVYIRNDVKEIELEVTLNEGKYSEIVQGLTE